MDKTQVRNALEIINGAILELSNGKTDDENFYWWRAVLYTFDLDVEDGKIIPGVYPKGSFADLHRFFIEWFSPFLFS